MIVTIITATTSTTTSSSLLKNIYNITLNIILNLKNVYLIILLVKNI